MKTNHVKKIIAIFLILVMCLSACDNIPEENKMSEVTTLTLATFDNNLYLQKQVDLYNQTHDDYQIGIQRYERSEQMEEDGLLLLQREIVSGKGPDIIDFGSGYTTSDIVGAYTEDLYSYMGTENQEDYFENVLTAFSYGECLYAVPLGFTLESFVGTKKNLGDRSSWTIEEMMECYGGQKKGKTLYPGAFKIDVFGTLLTGSMEYYIDWNTGICNFAGEEFRNVMEFCNGFPDHLEIPEDFSVKQAFMNDVAMLMPISFSTVYDICRAELIFDEQEIEYIGFPVEGTCGTIIQTCGPVLAISRNSIRKDAAWDFISWCLSKSCQSELPLGFPVCRSALEEKIAEAIDIEYEMDQSETQKPMVKQRILFEGEDPIPIYCITQEQAEQLLALIESAVIGSSTDRKIYHIFFEEAEYYFNGTKSLDETVDVIQARVSMYVNERIK